MKILGRSFHKYRGVVTYGVDTDQGRLTLEEARKLIESGELTFHGTPHNERAAIVRLIRGIERPNVMSNKKPWKEHRTLYGSDL